MMVLAINKGEDSLLSFVTFYNNAKWALSIIDFI